MKKLLYYIKIHSYKLVVVGVLLLSIVLRFYNYSARWGLAYDQAHDVAVARYALENGEIPLVGPFSSSGPFQTGGQWYWIIMAGIAINKSILIAPWVFMTMLYVGFVYLSIRFGQYLIDKRFGIILGLFAAISTAQITQGTNLTNQSPLALSSLAALWFGILYIRTKKVRYAFFASFFVVTGALIHLQGAGIIFLPLFLLLFVRKNIAKFILSSVLGAFIPLIPVIVFDFQNDFVNSSGFIRYLTQNQYAISYEVLGRRWLTYLFSLWPEQWSFVIGGGVYIGYGLIALVGLLSVYALIKKKLQREILFTELVLLSAIVIIRYVRTPLFQSYFVFLHIFVLVLSAWAIYYLLSLKKILGLIVISIIVILTLNASISQIRSATNTLQYKTMEWRYALTTYFPDEKYSIYDFELNTRGRSVPLTILLDINNELDLEGKKIGMMFATSSAQLKSVPVIYGGLYQTQLVDLSEYTDEELSNGMWFPINPKEIYLSTQKWYKK